MVYVFYKKTVTYHFKSLHIENKTSCGRTIDLDSGNWEIVDLERPPSIVNICRSCQIRGKGKGK